MRAAEKIISHQLPSLTTTDLPKKPQKLLMTSLTHHTINSISFDQREGTNLAMPAPPEREVACTSSYKAVRTVNTLAHRHPPKRLLIRSLCNRGLQLLDLKLLDLKLRRRNQLLLNTLLLAGVSALSMCLQNIKSNRCTATHGRSTTPC